MEDFNDEFGESQQVFMSGAEAEKFTKAFWRNPREEELEELALFIARDYVESEQRFFNPEMDLVEKMIMLEKEKQDTLKQLANLTRVLDMSGVNALVFYTLDIRFSKTQKTDTLLFEDGLVRFLKKDGVLRELDPEIDVLFEL